jgi:hypothetical protein
MTMKRFLIGPLLAGGLLAQTYTVPLVDTTGKHAWPKLGGTLIVTNGVLDVAPVPAKPNRAFGKVLSYDSASGTYRIPGGGTATVAYVNMVVFVNGLRYTEGIDYTFAAGFVTPLLPATNWPAPGAGTIVVADFDQQ